MRATHQRRFQLQGLTLSSDFDSGNLLDARRPNRSHLELWVGPDVHSNYRSWLYFSVAGAQGLTLSFTVNNFSHQLKLIGQGLLPVFRNRGQQNWTPISQPITRVDAHQEGIQFTFSHSFTDSLVELSFFRPWSNIENEALIQQALNEATYLRDCYAHRSTLAMSRQGREIALLTISSNNHKQKTKEELDSAFPNRDPPARFSKAKQCVLISARVHPGETPSSFVMNGIIRSLVASTPEAQALRQKFVFYLVPILNPDGVARGHYRLDSKGVNLNRCYITPKIKEHGAVLAVKDLALSLHRQGRLHSYIDLHAHAGRRGCFIYGNYSPLLAVQSQICLYPRLLALRNPDFDYESCNFTEGNMYCKDKADFVSKEGTGRVTLFKKTKNPRCWTLECSFLMSRLQNLPCSTAPPLSTSQLMRFVELPKKQAQLHYNQGSYQRLGKDMLETLLELEQAHPDPVLTHSPFQNIANLRIHTSALLLRMLPFRFQACHRRTLQLLDSDPDRAADVLRDCGWDSRKQTVQSTISQRCARKVSTFSEKRSAMQTESSSPQKGRYEMTVMQETSKDLLDDSRRRIFRESMLCLNSKLDVRVRLTSGQGGKRCTIVNLAIEGSSRALHSMESGRNGKRLFRGLKMAKR